MPQSPPSASTRKIRPRLLWLSLLVTCLAIIGGLYVVLFVYLDDRRARYFDARNIRDLKRVEAEIDGWFDALRRVPASSFEPERLQFYLDPGGVHALQDIPNAEIRRIQVEYDFSFADPAVGKASETSHGWPIIDLDERRTLRRDLSLEITGVLDLADYADDRRNWEGSKPRYDLSEAFRAALDKQLRTSPVAADRTSCDVAAESPAAPDKGTKSRAAAPRDALPNKARPCPDDLRDIAVALVGYWSREPDPWAKLPPIEGRRAIREGLPFRVRALLRPVLDPARITPRFDALMVVDQLGRVALPFDRRAQQFGDFAGAFFAAEEKSTPLPTADKDRQDRIASAWSGPVMRDIVMAGGAVRAYVVPFAVTAPMDVATVLNTSAAKCAPSAPCYLVGLTSRSGFVDEVAAMSPLVLVVGVFLVTLVLMLSPVLRLRFMGRFDALGGFDVAVMGAALGAAFVAGTLIILTLVAASEARARADGVASALAANLAADIEGEFQDFATAVARSVKVARAAKDSDGMHLVEDGDLLDEGERGYENLYPVTAAGGIAPGFDVLTIRGDATRRPPVRERDYFRDTIACAIDPAPGWLIKELAEHRKASVEKGDLIPAAGQLGYAPAELWRKLVEPEAVQCRPARPAVRRIEPDEAIASHGLAPGYRVAQVRTYVDGASKTVLAMPYRDLRRTPPGLISAPKAGTIAQQDTDRWAPPTLEDARAEPAAIIASRVFASTIDPVMPRGFGFTVFDDATTTALHHSDRSRVLVERFSDEVSNTARFDAERSRFNPADKDWCPDAMGHRTKKGKPKPDRAAPDPRPADPKRSGRLFSTDYAGEAQRMMLRDLCWLPWTLVVSYDRDAIQQVATDAARAAALALASLLLSMAIVIAAIDRLFLGRRALVWLWPHVELQPAYRLAAVRVVGALLFMMVGLIVLPTRVHWLHIIGGLLFWHVAARGPIASRLLSGARVDLAAWFESGLAAAVSLLALWLATQTLSGQVDDGGGAWWPLLLYGLSAVLLPTLDGRLLRLRLPPIGFLRIRGRARWLRKRWLGERNWHPLQTGRAARRTILLFQLVSLATVAIVPTIALFREAWLTRGASELVLLERVAEQARSERATTLAASGVRPAFVGPLPADLESSVSSPGCGTPLHQQLLGLVADKMPVGIGVDGPVASFARLTRPELPPPADGRGYVVQPTCDMLDAARTGSRLFEERELLTVSLLAGAGAVLLALAVWAVQTVNTNLFGLKRVDFANLTVNPKRAHPTRLTDVARSEARGLVLVGPAQANQKHLLHTPTGAAPPPHQFVDLSLDQDRLKCFEQQTDSPIWIITNLEGVLGNAQARLASLQFLETLKRVRARFVILSELSPLDRLLQARERDAMRQPTVADTDREEYRWSDFFADIDVRYAIRPERPLEPQEHRSVEDFIAREAAAILDVNIRRYVRDLREAAVASGVDVRRLTDFIAQYLSDYYQKLWLLCSEEERLVLYVLARRRFVNASNFAVLENLMQRGLVVRVPEFKLMNRSFARWVSTAESPETFARWQAETGEGLWRLFRLPLILLVLSAALVLTYFGREPEQSLFALLPAIIGAVPLAFARFAEWRNITR